MFVSFGSSFHARIVDGTKKVSPRSKILDVI